MSQTQAKFQVGQKVQHQEFGEGVVTGAHSTEFLEVFFREIGTKSVPLNSISSLDSIYVTALKGATSSASKIREFFLACELSDLPLQDNAATLTSARIDLLPHQVVLVHRVASHAPRRYLVADEVGLGKTIESALILRELASRGEMTRALMVVPAGLVENWRRELNEVFNLDFEVFGSEGDVTDRKSNAFAKHNRLIASVDTLKRTSRVNKILEAPTWDLVVFDEAQHLTAYEKSNNQVHKTENYKLAEALKDHTRDLILLSATPHQGDHFRFWRLIHLLDPTLFSSVDDMIGNRHRLNTVVIRRTKADACDPEGNTLFARRQVVTKSFHLGESEKLFYEKLNDYLREGFALASRSKGKGNAIGFVMTVFQKISASSFAAVRRTLQNRSIGLAILEAVLAEEDRDFEKQNHAIEEARELIRQRDGLEDSTLNNAIIDKYINDVKLKHLKKKSEELPTSALDDEVTASSYEDKIGSYATVGIPGERAMIQELLRYYPVSTETKVQELNKLLSTLWKENPKEKIVIFATYLGTVDMLKSAIEAVFPGKQAEIYKGGDHSAKIAAEKRFKAKDGPQVMLCTAAGREGINLQYARILVNFDLPWNPMDMEQRIGRIHRYGQANTAQVYNFVSIDTIEGKIFITLEEKIHDIAATLGKVDGDGQVAEDLRSQILGQLSANISYDQLYRDALGDPELKRTAVELQVALKNAEQAQEVVFELFQDLDGFDVSEYKGLQEGSTDLGVRMFNAVQMGVDLYGGKIDQTDTNRYKVDYHPLAISNLTATDSREIATSNEKIELLGFDHSIAQDISRRLSSRKSNELAVAVRSPDEPFLLLAWQINFFGEKNTIIRKFIKLAVSNSGRRLPEKEYLGYTSNLSPISVDDATLAEWMPIVESIPETLERDLKYRGLLSSEVSYQANLVGILIGC